MASDKCTILIVEDEPLLRMLAIDLVTEAGFRAVAAANAEEAIKILETRFDIRIVFTDVDMPGDMNGAKLASVIRNRWPPMDIVVTSGFFNSRDISLPERCVLMQKPYDLDELIGIFRSFLPTR